MRWCPHQIRCSTCSVRNKTRQRAVVHLRMTKMRIIMKRSRLSTCKRVKWMLGTSFSCNNHHWVQIRCKKRVKLESALSHRENIIITLQIFKDTNGPNESQLVEVFSAPLPQLSHSNLCPSAVKRKVAWAPLAQLGLYLRQGPSSSCHPHLAIIEHSSNRFSQ